MTRIFEFATMPHRVDVVCPNCRRCAEFEFAEVVSIKSTADREFFQKSGMFDYARFKDGYGSTWHGALYFQGLHGSPHKALHDLPAGYRAEQWDHALSTQKNKGWKIGSLRCSHCALRSKHQLNWPDEAYFSAAYRAHVLWAFHRESAVALMQFLQSEARNEFGHGGWALFLWHVPSVFKTRKARETVVKRLCRLLDASPSLPRPTGA
jgi:hypothetical protein